MMYMNILYKYIHVCVHYVDPCYNINTCSCSDDVIYVHDSSNMTPIMYASMNKHTEVRLCLNFHLTIIISESQ